MGTNLMGELVANNGTFIVNSYSRIYELTIDAIVVLEETLFDSIMIGEDDVKNDYIASVGTTIKAGAIITPTNDLQFSGVRLVSGSVALVLG